MTQTSSGTPKIPLVYTSNFGTKMQSMTTTEESRQIQKYTILHQCIQGCKKYLCQAVTVGKEGLH